MQSTVYEVGKKAFVIYKEYAIIIQLNIFIFIGKATQQIKFSPSNFLKKIQVVCYEVLNIFDKKSDTPEN